MRGDPKSDILPEPVKRHGARSSPTASVRRSMASPRAAWLILGIAGLAPGCMLGERCVPDVQDFPASPLAANEVYLVRFRPAAYWKDRSPGEFEQACGRSFSEMVFGALTYREERLPELFAAGAMDPCTAWTRIYEVIEPEDWLDRLPPDGSVEGQRVTPRGFGPCFRTDWPVSLVVDESSCELVAWTDDRRETLCLNPY